MPEQRPSTLVPVQRGGLTFYELNPALGTQTVAQIGQYIGAGVLSKRAAIEITRREDKPSYRQRQARGRARKTKRPPKGTLG